MNGQMKNTNDYPHNHLMNVRGILVHLHWSIFRILMMDIRVIVADLWHPHKYMKLVKP